tara:strand:+ start:1932 stop:2315 length:384 start_codon:yes stop_codon:yes gene_type:complete
VAIMDLRNFVSADALNLFLETKGWKMIKPIIFEEQAVFKPDFYEDMYMIAQGKYGKICARGQSKINYQGNSFDSVEMLISKHGKTAIGDFDNWEFLEEKEWVIYKNGDWLHSFTTLLELPKASKFRC